MLGEKWLFLVKKSIFSLCIVCLMFFTVGCSFQNFPGKSLPDLDLPLVGNFGASLHEVAPPLLIQQLKANLEVAPELEILSPANGQTLDDNSTVVQFSLKGLSLYKDSDWNLGPHIGLWLDNEAYPAIFDAQAAINLNNLKPGTHTIRAIAQYPWNESFKNPEAYAQISFNVFTATTSETQGDQPQLLLLDPVEIETPEPLMLDYVVSDSESTKGAMTSKKKDWHVQATVNGTEFSIDENGPIYLTDLPTGKNWIKLKLLDSQGKAIAGPSNEQTQLRVVNPNGTATIHKIFRGDLALKDIGPIVGLPKPSPPVAPPTMLKSNEKQSVNSNEKTEEQPQSKTAIPSRPSVAPSTNNAPKAATKLGEPFQLPSPNTSPPSKIRSPLTQPDKLATPAPNQTSNSATVDVKTASPNTAPQRTNPQKMEPQKQEVPNHSDAKAPVNPKADKRNRWSNFSQKINTQSDKASVNKTGKKSLESNQITERTSLPLSSPPLSATAEKTPTVLPQTQAKLNTTESKGVPFNAAGKKVPNPLASDQAESEQSQN